MERMSAPTIRSLSALQILDSRGAPTLEVEVVLDGETRAAAMVPSGASTGAHEAVELRDGEGGAYGGRSVLEAAHNVDTEISQALQGMPVDRRDLLEILDLQDSIADTAQDIAGMMVVRRMKLPEPVHRPMLALTKRCVDACNQLAKIMELMDELLETGFRGPEADHVMHMIDELNLIETDTDTQAITVMRILFEHEDEIGPVSTIMWDRVIHWIGDLANFAERAGNRHRLLLAR